MIVHTPVRQIKCKAATRCCMGNECLESRLDRMDDSIIHSYAELQEQIRGMCEMLRAVMEETIENMLKPEVPLEGTAIKKED